MIAPNIRVSPFDRFPVFRKPPGLEHVKAVEGIPSKLPERKREAPESSKHIKVQSKTVQLPANLILFKFNSLEPACRYDVRV